MVKTIEHYIYEAGDILAICHIAPDGDAIGSLLGMGWAMHQMRKKHTLVCADTIPEVHHFLPGIEKVMLRSEGEHDLVITLDCSDPKRLGEACPPELLRRASIINIDHHITNTNFGTVNWVDPLASATAEMVTELVRRLGLSFTLPMATCLLNGIVTDTRGFRTPNITAHTLAIAIRLMEAGAPLAEIVERNFNRRTLSSMRLWAKVVDRVELLDGRIIWGEITHKMRQECGASESDDGGLANFLIGAQEADIAVVLAEKEDGSVDVSMRAGPGLDVSQVAVRLGGGGHPQAAGCTIQGNLAEAREKVRAEIKRSLRALPAIGEGR